MKKKWIVVACLVICFGISTGRMGQKNVTLTEAIAGEVKRTLYSGMVKSYMPSFYYETIEEEEQTAMELLADKVLGILPLYGYLQTQTEYETPVESQLSYETIIQREAMDENYIDEETGEVVLTSGYEENKILAEVENENAKARVDATETEKTDKENQQEIKEKEEEEKKKKDVADEVEPDKKKEQVQSEKEDSGKTLISANGKIGDFQIQTSPKVTYPREKLNDFDYLIQNFYTVDRSTTINSSQLVASELLARDMKMKTTPDMPQILIYHTHSQELFANSTPGDVMTGVVGCGEYLTQILTEQYGYHVIHHMGQYDVESRDNAYSYAAPAVEKILAEHPSIEVVIDLHRDAVPEDTHMVRNVQGINMAPIMFFNGLSRLADKGDIAYLENPYIMDNLAFSLQMKLAASEYYPELTRPVYLKGYRYNMHYCPKTLLVELGAQTNTYEEARNAMVPLADLLYKVLGNP